MRYIDALAFTRKNRKTLLWLKNLEEMLPSKAFLRVNKSYIVACSKVQVLNGNRLEIGEHLTLISRSKREEVMEVVFGK